MDIGGRLKLIRDQYGESQAKFSLRFGIAQNTWGQYEIGKRSIPDDLKKQLADIGINLHWLVTGDGSMYLSQYASADGLTHGSEAFPEYAYKNDLSQSKGLAIVNIERELIHIPLVCQKLPVGAGRMWSDESFTDDVIAVPTRMFKGFDDYKLGGAEVHGDAMQPIVCHGDIVFFAAQLISGNGVYALSIDNEVFIRRLDLETFTDTINVISDNEKYTPIVIPRKTDRVQIMGKVIGRFLLNW